MADKNTMLGNAQLIADVRSKAMGMEFSTRWLILEMANRLERAIQTGAEVKGVENDSIRTKRSCENCAYQGQNAKPCEVCYTAVNKGKEISDPSEWREKPVTNADRIRAMCDDMLACFLADISPNFARKIGGKYINNAEECIRNWLTAPAE